MPSQLLLVLSAMLGSMCLAWQAVVLSVSEQPRVHLGGGKCARVPTCLLIGAFLAHSQGSFRIVYACKTALHTGQIWKNAPQFFVACAFRVQ